VIRIRKYGKTLHLEEGVHITIIIAILQMRMRGG